MKATKLEWLAQDYQNHTNLKKHQKKKKNQTFQTNIGILLIA
jgi:hypothetical protein